MVKSAPPGVGHHNCHAGLYVISGDRCFRAPGGSRSFRYSSIARMISFLTFSIVTSSRRWIPISSLTFLGCFGWPVTSKPSPQVAVTTPLRGTIK